MRYADGPKALRPSLGLAEDPGLGGGRLLLEQADQDPGLAGLGVPEPAQQLGLRRSRDQLELVRQDACLGLLGQGRDAAFGIEHRGQGEHLGDGPAGRSTGIALTCRSTLAGSDRRPA